MIGAIAATAAPFLIEALVKAGLSVGKEGLSDLFGKQEQPEMQFLTGKRKSQGLQPNTPQQSALARYGSAAIRGATGGLFGQTGNSLESLLKADKEKKFQLPEKDNQQMFGQQQQQMDWLQLLELLKQHPELLNELLMSGQLTNKGNLGLDKLFGSIRK